MHNILGLQDILITGKEPWGLDCTGRGQDPGPAEADSGSGVEEVREVAGMGTKIAPRPAQMRRRPALLHLIAPAEVLL